MTMIHIVAATTAMLVATAATAQAADPHAGHGAAGSTPTSSSDAMPGMDHGAMSGMDHSKMNKAPAAPAERKATAMPGMDHGAMSGMDSSMAGMNMAPTPKNITRRISGPAEAALQAFSDALEVGNRELAIERLAPEVRIVENSAEEDFASYVGGHLASDMAFQKSVKTILLDRQVRINGATTTVTSKTRLMSNRSDKAIDIVVSETATLAKSRAGWKIVKLEWNSAPDGS